MKNKCLCFPWNPTAYLYKESFQDFLFLPTTHLYIVDRHTFWAEGSISVGKGFQSPVKKSSLIYSSRVIKASHVAVVVVISNQHFPVLIHPEAVEVDQDAGDSITLATVHQILQCDLIGVFWLHHVKDLILKKELGHIKLSTLLSLQIKD